MATKMTRAETPRQRSPVNDPGRFYQLWMAQARLERRAKLLGYIRDIRELLQPWGASRAGDGPQAYRDRWSALCRQLCEDGKPLLHDVSCGNSIPAEVLL